MVQTESNKMDIDGLDTHVTTKLNKDSNSLPRTSKENQNEAGNEGKRRTSKTRKISSRDIAIFCEQLEDFVSQAQKFRKNVAGYQTELQERLNSNIKNLELLFIETRESVNNIHKMKTQHKFVKKDIVHTKDILKKIKKEETQEKENQVSKCDKSLYKLWETVKKSIKVDLVNNFLAELQDKSIAVELLKELANQKLTEMQRGGTPLILQFNTPLKTKEKSIKSLTHEPRKLTRPIRYSKKRKFSDRNEVHLTIQDSSTSLTPQQQTTLQTSNPLSLTMNRDSTVSYSSSQSTEKTNSTQSLSMTLVSSIYDRPEPAAQDNMQSVLQALFGGGRQDRQADNADSLVGFDLFRQDSTFLL